MANNRRVSGFSEGQPTENSAPSAGVGETVNDRTPIGQVSGDLLTQIERTPEHARSRTADEIMGSSADRGNSDKNGDGPGADGAWGLVGEHLRHAKQPWGLPDDPTAEKYPTLWQHLADRQFPSGLSREGGYLRLELTRTGCRITLTDISIGYKIRAETEHAEDALAALERTLRLPRAPWEPITYGEAANERKSREKQRLTGKALTGRPGIE